MAEENYPFVTRSVLFRKVHVERKPEVPAGTEYKLQAVVLFPTPKEEDLIQVNLRLENEEDSPVWIQLEVIAIYRCVGVDRKAGYQLIVEYLENQGLNVLWSQASLMVRMLTAAMEIEPIVFHAPMKFDLGAAREAILKTLENK